MSASEKLRALEREQALEGRFPHWETDGDLLRALPQIVAVVEAAEAVINYGSDIALARGVVLAQRPRVDAALSALEKALS